MKFTASVGIATLSLVVGLAGCGSSSPQGADNPAQAQAVKAHLDGFGQPGMTTSWYPSIGTVSVKGDTVIVQTNLSAADEKAKGVCAGTSTYVFSNENASAGLKNIQILGAGGEVLIDRQGIAGRCS